MRINNAKIRALDLKVGKRCPGLAYQMKVHSAERKKINNYIA
jgi:hypothetical protein